MNNSEEPGRLMQFEGCAYSQNKVISYAVKIIREYVWQVLHPN